MDWLRHLYQIYMIDYLIDKDGTRIMSLDSVNTAACQRKFASPRM